MDNNALMVKNVSDTKIASYQAKYADVLESVGEHFDRMYGNNKTWGEDVDAAVIGKYCETVEENLPFILESAGTSTGNLGDMLKGSLGLVAAQYATSIIPFIGATQPAENEIAMIYYKTAVANTARGSINAGDTIINPFGRVNANLDEYTGTEQAVQAKLAEGTNFTNSSKTATIKLIPEGRNSGIQVGTIAISVSVASGSKTLTAIDKAKENASVGNIYGTGIDAEASTINYDTGVLTLKFTENGIAANDIVDVVFLELITAADEVPSFKYKLTSEALRINYWPVQTSWDSVSDFLALKKFGSKLSDLASKDLLSMINNLISYNAIKQLRNATIRNEADPIINGPIKWSVKAAAGVSLVDHRRTFEDVYEFAHRRMELLTGLGGVSAIIVGSEGRKIYRALGMKDIERGKAGAYVLGFWTGIPVIYAPSQALPANEILVIYKGDDWFTTPLVYAPFMPVMTAEAQGRLQNVFAKQMGIVHAAGLKAVNPGFVQRVVLTDTGIAGVQDS
ncbi:hypothetical protein [Campylobacter jejuni]|uniref:Uncharacterized protein n=1 Tax=Campylobacter jejuni TaxID=197 RepID=A0A431EEF6_CAMJU|nr:hypothetical protein [Campylobacter jejuni]RTJ79601.1 hypothetical protein C3H57_04320 [Campylobacter jejuni]